MVRRTEKKKKKSWFRKIVTGILSALFVLLLTLGLVGIVIYKSGEMSLKASASTSAPSLEVDEEEIEKIREELGFNQSVAWQDDWVTYEGKVYEYRKNTLNFLLMGIDHGGELPDEAEFFNWEAGRADTIFLLSLNQDDKTFSVIGIPRNSMIDVEVYNSEKECIDVVNKEICLQYAYAGGGEFGLDKMTESVSELFGGLPIHGACAVSFDAVSVITDRLGGIEIVVPDDMTAYKNSYTQGSTQTLTGKDVVEYLRYRGHAFGSSIERLTRQKEFMKTAIQCVLQEIKENPAFVKDVYEAVKPYMNTDITADEAVYVATKALDCTFSEQSFYQLTGEGEANYINDHQFYNEYYLDENALKKIMMDVFYKEVNVFGR